MTKIAPLPVLIRRLFTEPLWLVLASGLFAASVLGYALYTQFFEGLHPCELCIFQRIPYAVIIVLALGALAYYSAAWPMLVLVALAFAVNTGLGYYHVGVEQHWWSRAGCGGNLDMSGSIDDLMKQIQNAPVAKCDQVQWTFIGLSMAAWNAILCAIGTLVCATVAVRTRPKKTA
jgi:disulfide bond formation protein DsbB